MLSLAGQHRVNAASIYIYIYIHHIYPIYIYILKENAVHLYICLSVRPSISLSVCVSVSQNNSTFSKYQPPLSKLASIIGDNDITQ